MKVYHKKSHHKCGIKILETDDNDFTKALELIKEKTNILDHCLLTRWWEKDDKVYMDYGSHHAYIVFTGKGISTKN